jgi:iron(III) transport system ATP-binding protein
VPPPQLEVRAISVAYGGRAIVRAVSFVLETGSIGCLLGPSGCGKTTVLRALAGFEPVTDGAILIGGREVSVPGRTLAPEARRIGMVFQDFALFPHLSVAANVGFGLRRLPRREAAQRVAQLLDLVGLTGAARHYPHQLSGGMQQRVALARAMAPRPEILLLDEPFSSMDADLREQLAREVGEVLRRDGVTAVLVTHDQHEAFAMADQIGVLGQGQIEQWGTGFDLYHEPVNRFVADFIGQGVMLPGEVVDAMRVKTELGRVAGERAHGLPAETAVEVLIRPDDLVYDESSPRRATVVGRAFRGAEYLYTLRLASGTQVLCLVASHHQHAIGDVIGMRLEARHLVVFAQPA